MTNTERDTVSRNRIVSETGRNFFVEAGAGSGKTTMLVSRMVSMVEAGIDISRICAITFTKAAAGEFYDRFQKLLIERSNPDYVWEDKGFAGQLPAPTNETRARCAAALQNIDLCFMGTIDSFCSMVLSEHPSEARIPSDASIMTDKDAEGLFRQLYVKICAGEYGSGLKELATAFRSFHWNAEEVFVMGESFLMDNRNAEFIFNAPQISDVDRELASDREQINRALQCLLDHPELKYEAEKGSLAAWEKLPDSAKALRRTWSYNFPGVISALNALKGIRALPCALEKYAVSLGECFEPGGAKGKWLDFKPGKPGGLCERLENLCYDTSMTFLSACVPVIEQAMREKGAMTFFDCLYYLREMLKRDAAGDGRLIRYIYDRHSYFLIDEFQDTNPLQAEVFFYLSSEHPVERWSECVPRQGSLFIVGDPKQSIYRFRSADVSSFLRVKKLFEQSGGDILQLSRNFRSTDHLKEYFNSVFGIMLPEETADQSKFEPIPLPKEDSEAQGAGNDEFTGVFRYTAYGETLAPLYPGESDPEQLRKIIQRLVGSEDFKISVKGSALRPIAYGDIMIIVYGKTKISSIMQEFDAYGIPMRVEGKVPFEDNVALQQISLVYNAVADIQDKNALYSALKGLFFENCDKELMLLCLEGGEISLKAANKLSEETPETAEKNMASSGSDELLKAHENEPGVRPEALKAAQHIAKLRELAAKADRLSPAALFAEIMDGFEVFRVAPAKNIEVLYYTLELMRSAEKAGLIVSPQDGADFLKKLLKGEAEQERCLRLSESEDCVHIANLHKVKGLEAPVVILALATKFANGVQTRIEHSENGVKGFVFALKGEEFNSRAFFKTEAFSEQMDAEKAAINAERDRLLYVAATRARNALIVCDSIFGKESRRSIWKPLFDGHSEDFFETFGKGEPVNTASREKSYGKDNPEIKAEQLYEKAKENCVLNVRDCEIKSYTLENPRHVRLTSKLSEEGTLEEGFAAGNGGIARGVKGFAALMGTMTHRLMEMIITSRNCFDISEAVREIISEYSTPKSKPFEAEMGQSLKQVADVMLHGGYEQTNGAPKDIVQVLLNADEVYCEVPFCYREVIEQACGDGSCRTGAEAIQEKATIWNGVMDVVYREGDSWHILDYKTNYDGSGLDEKYRAQLEAYKKALKATTGHEADACTYHIDI